MGDSSISWLFRPNTRARTWNPTQGCEMVSPGCKNCYAMRIAARYAANGWSNGLIDLKTKKWSREGRVAVHKLAEPLSWREPSTVFVNSMSDLFWEKFTNEEIAAIFGIMAACPRHTFIIATKRAKRMRQWFQWADPVGKELVSRATGGAMPPRPRELVQSAALQALKGVVESLPAISKYEWPLPNVWLLVSVESQEMANERIPELLETPAVVRGLSCEPLLSGIHLTLHGTQVREWDEDLKYDVLRGLSWTSPREWAEEEPPERGDGPRIHWVIAGCESGPEADIRPAQTAWFRDLRDQCQSADVPFFLKQAKVTMEGIGGNTGDLRPGRIAEPPLLDGAYHQGFPG